MIEHIQRRCLPRLLVVTSTYPRWSGDPEPGFVHELAKRLVDRFEVHVVGPHATGAKVEDVLDGVRVHRYRYAPDRWETLVNHGGMLTNLRRSPWKWLLLPGFLMAQLAALRRVRRHIGPAVVHAHWLLPQGLLASFGAAAPLVITSHGADLFGLRGRFFAKLRRRVVARSAAITVVSEAMARRLAEEGCRGRVRVLPMGVDIERFSVGPTPRHGSRLLFVGRMVQKKGLRHLLDAMPALVAAHAGLVLDLAGFGPEEAALRAQVAALGLGENVRFLGAMSQAALPPLYRQATVFVAPFVEADGDQEGLGLVVAEAMACGCPVVVGDVAGVRDLVGERTGVRVNARDANALAATILALLADPARRRQLGSAGRDHVRTHYAWPVVASRYADLLQDAAAGLGAAP